MREISRLGLNGFRKGRPLRWGVTTCGNYSLYHKVDQDKLLSY